MIIYATDEQMIEMIKAQEELNKKYNGENWRKDVRPGWAKMAFLVEIAEMANEILPSWAWWKKNVVGGHFDRMKFEFIDVLHFAMLIALHRFDVETLCEHISGVDPDQYGPVGDPHDYFIKAVNRFLRAANNDDVSGLALGLKNIIHTGSVLVHMQPGEVYKAYCLKNRRNHERVEGGVMDGTYDKAAESELKL